MNNKDSKSLATLIGLCQDGDDKAWHELIDIIAPLIFSICRRSRLSRDESFDIFGQVCLDLVKTIRNLKTPEKILPFAATIARRRIYGFYENMNLLEVFPMDAGTFPEPSGGETPEAAYELTQRRELLLEAMLQLPRKEYLLLQALFFDPGNPSYKEIAARLKCPLSSIGPTRARALAKLERILKQKKFKLQVFFGEKNKT